MQRARRRIETGEHLQFICRMLDLIYSFRYGQECSTEGCWRERTRLKLRVLNQNPPPAALKLSPVNTRGFWVKREGCLSHCTAGRGEQHSCRSFAGNMQYEWFGANTHTHTHSGAVTRIQAASDICSSPHMPPINKVLMGSSLGVLQALWSTSYNMSFHVEVMKLGPVSSGWNLNPIQPLTFPSASHSSFLLK